VKIGTTDAAETLVAVHQNTKLLTSEGHILAICGGEILGPHNYIHIFVKRFCDIYHCNYEHSIRLIYAH
jgi:hypothetical protein